MKRWLWNLAGWGLCSALLAAALYALNGPAFRYYLNDRILENSRLTSVEGIFFKTDTRSIVQPIDLRQLHVGRPELANSPVCLRLWMGSKFLVNIDQKLRVHLQSGTQQWTAGPAFTHHKTRLFCFNDLNVATFAALKTAQFELDVLDASDTQNLAAIHAGRGTNLVQASVNGLGTDVSVYFMVEAKPSPKTADLWRYFMVVFFASWVLLLIVKSLLSTSSPKIKID